MNIITILKKIKIHYSLILLFIFSVLLGIYTKFLLVLFILLSHEIGHIIFLNLFNVKIYEIKIYPFGAIIKYLDDNLSNNKNLLIYMGGVFVNILLAVLFFNFKTFRNVNILFIILNLIPVIPFDGGRIFINLFSRILPIKLVKKNFYIFSFCCGLTLFIFLIFSSKALYFIMIGLLLLRMNYINMISINEEYENFMLYKYLKPNSKLKEKTTRFWTYNPLNSLFKGYNTTFDYDSFKVNERVLLEKHFKSNDTNIKK